MMCMARFVSNVPYMEESGLSKRRHDIWTSSSEMMSMAAGDCEEHAHLLAGFFLEIGQQVSMCVCGGGGMGRQVWEQVWM